MVSYKKLLPVASLLIIISLSFTVGILFANWPYEYFTLWDSRLGDENFEDALKHYVKWLNSPSSLLYILHGMIGLGFIGAFIRVYKPSEETTYFEYGTLVAMVAAVSIYLTNIRVGAFSCLYGEWGEVDQNTGLAVIAASASLIVFIYVGVILIQASMIYAAFEDAEAEYNYEISVLQDKIKQLESGSSSSSSSSATPSATTTSADPVPATATTKATKKTTKAKSKKT